AERPPSERDGKGTNFPRSPKCFAPRTIAFFYNKLEIKPFFFTFLLLKANSRTSKRFFTLQLRAAISHYIHFVCSKNRN
ncbi:MAG: hypothetical protein QHC79_27735, partial [Pseudosphingobacterium sp.]|nr:hypothetical protein [Pseudosphingobacterium sp.]